MLSHDNVTFAVSMASKFVGMRQKEEVVMSYLPLSHVAAQVFDLYMMIYNGGTVGFADKDALKGTLVGFKNKFFCSHKCNNC